LGYHFAPGGLSLAPQTIERYKARLARLYEQGADETRIGQYARRWWRWAKAGVTLTDRTGLPPSIEAAAVLTIEYLADSRSAPLLGREG
jgi:hypothetical protein